MSLTAPLFNRYTARYFFRVGLCSHTVFLLQDMWLRYERRIEAKTLDRMDRSPREQQLGHVLKIRISDGSPDDMWMRHNRSIVVAISSDDRDLLRSRSITRTHLDGPTQLLKIERWIAPHEEPRLTRDRGPIVARSRPDSCAIVAHSSPKWSFGIAESKASIFNFIR